MLLFLLLAAPLVLDDGDRVVLVGNTLIEREQRYGHWEAALVSAFPGKKLQVRNLGWSGDTVFGHARDGHAYTRTHRATVEGGYKHLKEHTLSIKPTVLIVAFGTNEAFDGEEGLPAFKKGLARLLDDLAPPKARTWLVAPFKQGTMPSPLPSPDKANANLKLYADAIRAAAKERKLGLIDLHEAGGDIGEAGWSDNGIHLTEKGYRESAPLLLKQLDVEAKTPKEPGKLRAAIVKKNELYFHRWRPQNETYLFGFRKHEQGNNGIEIPKFDPLVEAKEKEIAELSK
ncbi:MAG: SGNH/GDSL hydrolase family protein [Gemmataceae bacterium]|nr:SGNH/GDSL hydrolase family protein [Gemmataceae bacterium]